MSRIRLVEQDNVRPEVAPVYEEVAKARGGKVPNMFKAIAYSNLMLGPGLGVANFCALDGTRLPPRLKQMAYLAVSNLNDCEYCLERHSAVALKQGVTLEQIAALHAPNPGASPVFDEREKAIIEASEELTRSVTLSEGSFAHLQSLFDDEEIVELVYTASSANMFNRLARALAVELEPEFKK